VLIEAGIVVVAMTHFRHKVSWGPELLQGRDTYIRLTHTTYITYIHVCRRW
jgi:hypothetical protein